jgi:hypothetical protein
MLEKPERPERQWVRHVTVQPSALPGLLGPRLVQRTVLSPGLSELELREPRLVQPTGRPPEPAQPELRELRSVQRTAL